MKYSLWVMVMMAGLTVAAQKSNQVKWIAGTWKLKLEHGEVVEQWRVLNDSTLAGTSFFVTGTKDTILQETIELAFRKGEWWFIPRVAKQNNNQPVPFKVVLLKGNEFISVNPKHDFPQRIAYRRVGAVLYASIEGDKKGIYTKQNFDFTLE